ncbi:MAG: hypothetical protein IJ263_09405, partial [Paludibacteraceae bacterium]|nr:hypothetical protein [Paludibacteraceae bacterium]
MISEKISKLFSVLLLSVLTTPVFSSESEEFNDDMLLAQRSSSDNENKSENENKKTSRNERSARPVETRPARPSDARPQRPQAKPHAPSSGHAHHHDPQPPHHHHHHGGDVVVVVQDDANYTTSTSDYSSTYVSKDCDLDKFMLFVNLGFGVSYRGFSGALDFEDEEDGLFENVGY